VEYIEAGQLRATYRIRRRSSGDGSIGLNGAGRTTTIRTFDPDGRYTMIAPATEGHRYGRWLAALAVGPGALQVVGAGKTGMTKARGVVAEAADAAGRGATTRAGDLARRFLLGGIRNVHASRFCA